MFQVDYYVSHKYMTNSERQIMDLKGIPACAFVNGSATNPLLQILKRTTANLEPIMRPCPYFGELKLMNITSDLKELHYIYSEGTYRSRIKFYDNLDDNIYTLTVFNYMKSGMKN